MTFFQCKPGDDVGELEEWPFTNSASQYVIKEGSPSASGRLEHGGSGQTSRFGIWKCTKGSFECTEQGDEMMTLLSGRCEIFNHNTGITYNLQAGDTLFIKGGSRVTWKIIEDVIKVFYGHKADRYWISTADILTALVSHSIPAYITSKSTSALTSYLFSQSTTQWVFDALGHVYSFYHLHYKIQQQTPTKVWSKFYVYKKIMHLKLLIQLHTIYSILDVPPRSSCYTAYQTYVSDLF